MATSNLFRETLCAMTVTLAVAFWLPFCAFAEEPAASDPAPTMSEESAPPAEGADIQERGIRPGFATPGATLQPADPTFSAPTPSLTAIRNAMRITSKSVSVNLRIPPNLPVAVPVEVSVAYISPPQARRQTKTYDPATGLVILYHDAEGDGKPRLMYLDITLREMVPNGRSFTVHKQLTITPLYRVKISPLVFKMMNKCDTFGKNDITFRWHSPDGQKHQQKFDLGFGETTSVKLFLWERKETSAEANLKEPNMDFDERDPSFGSFNPMRLQDTALLPGPTKEFSFFLDEGATGPPVQQHSGSTKCKAHISYRITRTLLTFDQL